MEGFSFIYTIIIVVLYTANSIGFLALYLNKRIRVYFWISLLFLSYVVDVSLILAADIFPGFQKYILLENQSAWPTIVLLFTAFIYRKIIGLVFQKTISPAEWAIIGVSSFAAVLFTVIGASGLASAVPRVIIRCLNLALLIRALVWLSREKGEAARRRLGFFRLVLIFSAAVWILGSVYDLLCLVFSIERSYRNLVSELIGLSFVVFGLIYLAGSHGRAKVEGKRLRSAQEKISEDVLMTRLIKNRGLTKREAEITLMLSQGLSNQQIAESLYISYGTVKTHVYSIFKKLGVTRRSQISPLLDELRQA